MFKVINLSQTTIILTLIEKNLFFLLFFFYVTTVIFFFLKKNLLNFNFLVKTLLVVISAMSLVLSKEYFNYVNPLTFSAVKVKFFEKNVFFLISFFLDKTSIIFCLVILMISLFTLLFQNNYVFFFVQKERFLMQLNFFIISMVLLVLTNNWVVVLLSWEFLGVSSFFLINFFKNKTSVFKSSFKAFIFNKISDVCLILSFVFFYKINGTFFFNLNSFFFEKDYTALPLHKFFILFLTASAFTKSAQFLFFFWLPDSMEAPIPASALIHSATLVSAGIYLLLRFKNYFICWDGFKALMVVFSAISMLLFSLISLSQSDVKKLLAFSTISNCAFIYFLIFLEEFDIGLFYFSIHGFFKSFSFLIFGFLITVNNHKQDVKDWTKGNFSFNVLFNLFFFQVFFLSGMPLTLSYLVKKKIFFSINGFVTPYLIYLTYFMYSLFSYFYGIKIYFLLKKKNKSYYRVPSVDFKKAKVTLNLYLSYVTLILLFYSTVIFFLFKNTNLSLNSFLCALTSYFLTIKSNLNKKINPTLLVTVTLLLSTSFIF